MATIVDLTKVKKQVVSPVSRSTPVTAVNIIDLTSDEMPMDVSVSVERLAIFRKKVCEAFQNVKRHSISVEDLTKKVNGNNAEIFTENEINAALIQMADANQIMVSNGSVYLI